MIKLGSLIETVSKWYIHTYYYVYIYVIIMRIMYLWLLIHFLFFIIQRYYSKMDINVIHILKKKKIETERTLLH